jgi:uncharacterized protein YggU (UPF0235/DUF167 family)
MTVRVKVIPRSPRTEFAGAMADGTLKIRLAAVPEKGKANDALCAFLAAHYRVPRYRVSVISGQTAALKLVRIDGIAS